MRERDRVELRRFREEEERRSKEELERHASQYRETANKLIQMNQKAFTQVKDADIYISPSLQNARMEMSQAIPFNKTEAAKFVFQNPSYYPCPENFALLSDYFILNSCDIVDAPMWKVCYDKALALGLLKTGPDVIEPQTIQEQQEPELERIDANVLRPVAHRVESQGNTWGRDLQTGNLRVWSELELSRLSADQYKWVLAIPSIDGTTQIRPR